MSAGDVSALPGLRADTFDCASGFLIRVQGLDLAK